MIRFLPNGSLTEQVIVFAAFVAAVGALHVKVIRPLSRLLCRGLDVLEAVRENFIPDENEPTLPEQVTEIGVDVRRMADSLERVDGGLIELTERVGSNEARLGMTETRLDAHDSWISTHERSST